MCRLHTINWACFPVGRMDLVLSFGDRYFFSPYVYPETWPEDEPVRQIIGLLVVTNLGAAILYLLMGSLSYYFIFDHDLMKHPQFLEVCNMYFFLHFTGDSMMYVCIIYYYMSPTSIN